MGMSTSSRPESCVEVVVARIMFGLAGASGAAASLTPTLTSITPLTCSLQGWSGRTVLKPPPSRNETIQFLQAVRSARAISAVKPSNATKVTVLASALGSAFASRSAISTPVYFAFSPFLLVASTSMVGMALTSASVQACSLATLQVTFSAGPAAGPSVGASVAGVTTTAVTGTVVGAGDPQAESARDRTSPMRKINFIVRDIFLLLTFSDLL